MTDAESWLEDSSLNVANAAVVVQGTSGPQNQWWGGEHEDREGRVLSVLKTGSGFASTASVLFEDDSRLVVPVQYLAAVSPNQGDEALILKGAHKGQRVIARMEDDNMWVVSAYQDAKMFDVAADALVKILPE